MKSTLFILLLLTTYPASSQSTSKSRYWEAGLQLGLVNYSGDVAEQIVEISETGFGFGVFARHHFSSRFAIRTQLFTGNIRGTDAHARDPELNERSFRFQSNLLEDALISEWNIFNIRPKNRNGIHNFQIIPYLYFGVGGVLIQPEVVYFGPPNAYNKYVLYSLPEDGLSQKALFIPVGGGLRTQITNHLILGAEAGWRPTFSDYLDGVSLNGNPEKNDWYYVAAITISLTVDR